MELTHAQAREMIQFDADSALNADALRILKTHLASCDACRAYAESIHALESHLRRAMSRRWNLRPTALSIDAIKNRKPAQRTVMATRFAVITSAIVMFAVFTLGFSRGTDGSPQTAFKVPLIPTPSLQTTGTTANTVQVCEQIRYEVRPDDTLESITRQFSVSKRDLITANNLTSEIVQTGTEIIIPVCNFTPTSTLHPPTLTATNTPLLDGLAHTPDG